MKAKIPFTLVFIKQNMQVLLGYKTRGLGVGLWNGFGGKLEKNENIFEGVRRELKEESNLHVTDLKYLGSVTYEEDYNPFNSLVHIFTASNFTGSVVPSEEMNPIQWYNYTEIPYYKMWPDAKLWYPLMLKDKYFTAVFKYDSEGRFKENSSVIEVLNDIPQIFEKDNVVK